MASDWLDVSVLLMKLEWISYSNEKPHLIPWNVEMAVKKELT